MLSALPASRIFSCRCFRCCCCCCFQGRCGCTSPSACRGPAELRRRRGRSTSVVGRRCCRFPSRCSRLRSRCIRLPTFCYADEWQVVAPLRPRACSVEYRDELHLPVELSAIRSNAKSLHATRAQSPTTADIQRSVDKQGRTHRPRRKRSPNSVPALCTDMSSREYAERPVLPKLIRSQRMKTTRSRSKTSRSRNDTRCIGSHRQRTAR